MICISLLKQATEPGQEGFIITLSVKKEKISRENLDLTAIFISPPHSLGIGRSLILLFFFKNKEDESTEVLLARSQLTLFEV